MINSYLHLFGTTYFSKLSAQQADNSLCCKVFVFGRRV